MTLPGFAPRPDHSASSDLLAAVSGTILPRWTAEAGWQYNTDRSETQRLNVATRYQPGPGKVLNLAYRDTIDLVRQSDVSFQWPITSHWAAVGRWNYSMRDGRTLETLAGFEYDGGCWAFRAVGHRFVTALNAVSTSIFLQLELNGVSRIGSNPLDVLRRNVGGYTRLDRARPRTDDYHVPTARPVLRPTPYETFFARPRAPTPGICLRYRQRPARSRGPWPDSEAAAAVVLDRIVAVVNDEAITARELDERAQLAMKQLAQQGTSPPPLPVIERQLLDRMIGDRVQLQLAKETGLRVDDGELERAISRIAEQNKLSLQTLRETLERDGVPYSVPRGHTRRDHDGAAARARSRQQARHH